MSRLLLSEADVAALLSPGEAVDVVEESFWRIARGGVDNRVRERLPLPDGEYAVMACVDRELGLAGVKTYTWSSAGSALVVLLFSLETGECAAMLEADKLGQLRTGAASAVAARHLAVVDAKSLGVIGCGWQAAAQVACIRAAVPTLEHVVAYGPNPQRLGAFCRMNGCDPAASNQDAAGHDIVVTVTTSSDPVLRGEWLRDGALVCAVGANDPARRELDNAVLERAAFVCCDSREQSAIESGDVIEPVEQGLLDWLEVHELAGVVTGELQGRASERDIVVFKSNGMAAWDLAAAARVVELARTRGLGIVL